jgi:hypothetical protein
VSASSGKFSLYFDVNFLCEASSCEETPRIAAPLAAMSRLKSRSEQAWAVQPGVSSIG